MEEDVRKLDLVVRSEEREESNQKVSNCETYWNHLSQRKVSNRYGISLTIP